MSQKRGMLDWYFKTNLLTRIMVGLVAGCIVGILLGFGDPANSKAFVDNTKIFGDIFIRLLKMIVVPVIFFSLIAGAASIEPSRLGRVGVKIIAFYMATSAASVAVGLFFANLLQPGLGMEIVGVEAVKGKVAEAPSLSTIFLNIIPTNPAESLAKGDVLPIIFFAMLFGLAISFTKESEDPAVAKGANSLFGLVNAAAETMYKIVRGIMQYAPIGVFFLIAMVFAQQGAKALGPLLYVTVTVYLAFVALTIIGYGGLLAVYRLGVIKFFKGANEALITAFVTRSSNGTLPVTMRVSEEKLGVPRTISSFTLPLGATINMNGTAIYVGVCAMFIGYATGHPLTFEQQMVVVTTATLAAIGSAGVPGAGAIMLLMALESIGIKVEAGSAVAAAYAMILGIDALLDMGRTCLNVGGDMVCTAIVAKTEGELDMSKWEDQPTSAVPTRKGNVV
ncbi:dicarboxylate/amino acid:cation symporter [Rhodoferax fermentans]|uniref:Dicarboxylate/amino acid:cation symporter n=1 Tax=Rhodoferax fermentans TaxID=28066 RepID=A0A1T1APK5_RHOFE|nr:dicarboxylate/amino acid:cation symporter [Rhodoferax fermentans]OOV06024.1 dicarboxylate/amino acid:cation symporter [Rhodoferax fermentans]